MKKYRVNSSEHFNLMSMYEHLKVLEEEYTYGGKPFDDDFDKILERIEEVEHLLEEAPTIGSLVSWPTLKRIREIKEERQFIRYTRCLAAGMSEHDAGFAFTD